MTAERFRQYLKAAPFEPFVIHLANGRSIFVKHPETVMLSPAGRTAVVAHSGGCTSVIDLLLVTELEFGPAQD